MERSLLESFAARYVWWKSPEEACRFPALILAQVMNLGSYDDIVRLEEAVSAEELRGILRHAEAGQFSPRSWAFWHRRLGVASFDDLPPLPARRVA